MSDDIRSFEGINPVAGNRGAQTSPGRGLGTEINRTGAQDRERKRTGGGSSALGNVAAALNGGLKVTPEVSFVSFGAGRGGINFGALTDGILNKELDYG